MNFGYLWSTMIHKYSNKNTGTASHQLKSDGFPVPQKQTKKTSSGLSSRIRKTLETNCGKRIRWKRICHLGGDFSIEPEDCASGEKCGEKLDEKSQWLDSSDSPKICASQSKCSEKPAQSPFLWKVLFKLICFVTNILFDLYIFFSWFADCRHRSWGWAWLLF